MNNIIFKNREDLKNQITKDVEYQKNIKTCVLTFGTFDILHPGHEYYLNSAKKYSDYLVTIIGTDKNVEKIKGRKAIFDQNTRKHNLEKLNISDVVEIGDEENPLKWINIYNPKIICLGYDQEGFSSKLTNFPDIEIIRIKPFNETEYKSSLIRQMNLF